MEIGVALPTMARGYDRSTTLGWCAGIDAGPFSSISCGERITYHNPEMMVTLAAAAALTERVRVFVNLAVAPMHPPALVAKQLATLQVLSGGRLTVAVGVGGREHDYRALGVPFERRHARLDESVAEIGSLLAGEPPFDGADPVGPAITGIAAPSSLPGPAGAGIGSTSTPAAPDAAVLDAPDAAVPDGSGMPERSGRRGGDRDAVGLAGVEVLVGAMGPKGLGRAARWADGVSGFSLSAEGGEIAEAAEAARRAWSVAGRDSEPRVVSGCFYVLGVPEPAETLRSFTYDYLEIFGPGAARALSEDAPVWNLDRLSQVLDDAAAAGVDEFILVPASVEPACLEATVEACAVWLDRR